MIHLRSVEEIQKIRRACEIVAQVLEALSERVRPGVSLRELDREAERMIRAAGAEPAFLGYRGYPATICASVNEVVVHGIPTDRILREGDIVGLDVGARREGYCGDGARTVQIGRIDPRTERLLRTTREALARGIEQAWPGNRLHDISAAIQKVAETDGFGVVRDFVGHGIGSDLHEDPQVPNYGVPHTGPRLKPGMVLAIEPMVNAGTPEVKILEDGWTAVTRDGEPSCHFEDTIAITETGPEILTQCPKKNRSK